MSFLALQLTGFYQVAASPEADREGAHLLRAALGHDPVLSDAEVQLYAATAWTRLRPA